MDAVANELMLDILLLLVYLVMQFSLVLNSMKNKSFLLASFVKRQLALTCINPYENM